ncbi:MAG TPA: RNB domain-containing ribonuclease, partial [Candidatus Angelobacter sp.]|nr:RNB domain-containing ribonuclease [Candidatus Angelobacter sp.]
MNNAHPSHFDLQAAAKQIMLENGFEPDFPSEVQQQLAQIKSAPPQSSGTDVRDLRDLLWSSIDNDTSRDLDQIEYAEKLPDGTTKVMVGIADVDAFVPKDTPIDRHASHETTTVYTGVRNFP